MQLKGCLLVSFFLNVACLNNLSGKFLNWKYDSLKADQVSLRKKDPSSLVELFADQISLRKNESLVESLKKNPLSFVELFAKKADPEKISQIIGILEGLITDAASSLETLLSHQTEATNNLNTANSNLVTADTNNQTATVALSVATTNKDVADRAHEVAVGEQESAQLEKRVADQNYADQSPGLINEHSVLQEVIDTLRTLKGAHCKVTVAQHDMGQHGTELFEGAGNFEIFEGTGSFQLGSTANHVSSVKVEGEGCNAYGYTQPDCSGEAAGVITSKSSGDGLVTPSTELVEYWGCNDCAQCVTIKFEEEGSCSSLGGVNHICGDSPDFCEAELQTNGGTCTDFCSAGGMSCANGWDERSALTCVKVLDDNRRIGNGCDNSFVNQICKCVTTG